MDERRSLPLGGRFDLIDPIGVGGGAVVVRARDRHLPQQVAVKLLRSRDEELRRRFMREAEVLSALDHPSIVRILDHGREGEDLYIALELLAGPDLCTYLGRGPMPWRHVLEIGVQIAAALAAVHDQGLVHRDVKPANIVLTATASMRVKLIDFGVVRITDNYRSPTGAGPRPPTEAGRAPGTPGYQPPEAGRVEPSPSFDVYALGATLYQLLTGRLPDAPPRPPTEVDAPRDVWTVLAAALAPEPEDRTATADALGRALAAVLEANPVRQAPPRIQGRYELVGVAGNGGKADVMLVVHRGTGRDLVLKRLRSKHPEDRLRFAREAKLLDQCSHPSLPRFYDYAPDADPPTIVMAHAKGQPAARLCAPPALRPREVAAVGVGLARVVAELHARGVLHRDINASNVLIADDRSVTLLDLGCAELLEDIYYDVPAGERRYLTPPEARVKLSDGGIGQLAWSAPEARSGRWSPRSDVYSIGHLLFRLLTGKVPIRGADPPSDPRELAACPDDLADVVMRALSVDPQERPSAVQLAESLSDALDTEAEAHAQALAAAASLGRPPLRLVRDEAPAPQAPIAAATDAPRTSTAATPSAPRRAWRRGFSLAVIAIGGALLAGSWVPARPGVLSAASRMSTAIMASGPRDSSRAPTDLPPPALAAVTAEKTAAPSTAEAALEAAAPALRGCAEPGTALLVEYTIAAQADRFTAARLFIPSPSVQACLDRVIAPLRFSPGPARTLSVEHTP